MFIDDNVTRKSNVYMWSVTATVCVCVVVAVTQPWLTPFAQNPIAPAVEVGLLNAKIPSIGFDIGKFAKGNMDLSQSPFYHSSVAALVSLAVSVVTCSVCIAHVYYHDCSAMNRKVFSDKSNMDVQLSLMFISAIALVLAPTFYLLLSYNSLHGGHYLLGFWTTVVGGVLSLGLCIACMITRSDHLYEPIL